MRRVFTQNMLRPAWSGVVSQTSMHITEVRTRQTLLSHPPETRRPASCPQTIVCVTPAGVTYLRDLGLQGLPLPFGEHGSCVRPSLAVGIAGLAASASSVPARVSSAVLIFAAATLPGGQPAHSAAGHAA